MANSNEKSRPIDRRTALRRMARIGGAAGLASIAGPEILIRTARANNQIVFISEESNPAAIEVFEAINADFRTETGYEVLMEYPGFANIAQRVATLIAAGTPPETVWYGAGSAMELAIADQLEDVSDVVRDVGGIPDNLRLVYQDADRSIPTSQQFYYGWYRSDLYEEKGLDPYQSWEDYVAVCKALNDPPRLYGNIIPSAESGASHILLETYFRKNDVHWFRYDEGNQRYEVALDEGDNRTRAIETLDFLHEAHQYSPEASTADWGDLMSTYVSEKVANSSYIGARLLLQVVANNSRIADVTKPIALPGRVTDKYYLSIQGFHVPKGSNVEMAKTYIRFFLGHPRFIDWLHAVPLHITPASREVLHSDAYQNNEFIQKRMDVLEFLDSIWGLGVPTYYWDGPVLNPLTGLYENDNLGGWMLAQRNIRKLPAADIVDQAAKRVRDKMQQMG